MSRRLPIFDPNTGEVKGIMVWVPSQPFKVYRNWMAMNQEALTDIAADREITGVTLRVLIVLLSMVDFENYISVPAIEIAERLSLHRSEVSKAIKTLLDKHVLLEGPKAGRIKTYRLNPHYGYKGSQKGASKLQLEIIKGGKPD